MRLPTTLVGFRLFLTCWLVYGLHFATDFVREHYLVMSIVESHTYALDPYYGLHVDIFKNPPRAKVQGAHHGANPGISMLAAVPYFFARPVVDRIVARELTARRAHGDTVTAIYRDERAQRVEFYKTVRQRGLDLRFGLVGIVTMLLCMAPLSAGSVVLLFGVLERIGVTRVTALGLSLLYAFGTPVFFRTGYLNQNLGLGMLAFFAFGLLWNPAGKCGWSERTRFVLAGGLAGLAFLCDYSGFIPLGLLGLYAWSRAAEDGGAASGLRRAAWYALGAMPGILLLWQYQWASFGNPFLPPQNWMAPVEWIDVGYKGVGGLSPELIRMLLVDPRFGLLITMPMAVLAPFSLWLARRGKSPLAMRETVVCLAISVALILFFGTVQYTRLQWVTGIRYLAAALPFLFVATVPALLRLPRLVVAGIAMLSLLIGWSMAMVRSPGTVLDNVTHVLVEGLQLPWLTVLSKMSAQYLPWLSGRPSPGVWFLGLALVLWLVWGLEDPFRRLSKPVA
jgi:hypothetical protein